MKKVIIILVGIIILLIASAAILPVIFKDDIRAAVDKVLDENLDAEVYYDEESLSLSLFSNFPDLSLTIEEFGIAGVGVFEGDTLVDVKSFQVTLDILSVIKGDKLKIINVLLDEPSIKVLVREDGKANYDIAKATEDEDETVTESDTSGESAADFSIQFQGWEIRKGNILYDDKTLPMVARLFDLNHTGSGDFSADVFDMVTNTVIGEFSLGYDGVIYMSKKILTADITMDMDMSNMKFTFKQNDFSLNNFAFGMDGFVSMPAEDIDMDIEFVGKNIDMKSVLSLVPGDYETYLDGVNATGTVGFNGYVKGTYNETSMPKVLAHFQIDEGKIAYANYPVPMDNIFINATFDYPSLDLRETSFIVDKFSMSIDENPFAASLIFKDFEDYFWDLKVNGSFDLEKITNIVPLEGMELKGIINTAMQTTGRMSDLEAERYTKIVTSGKMDLDNFQYIADDLPQGFGIKNASLTFDPKTINLVSFKGNAGKTDLNMDGKLTNYLEYALADDATLYGTLNFYSSGVFVDEWMSEEAVEEEIVEEDTASIEAVRLPENIDFVFTSKIDLIQYDNLDLKDFAGKVVVREGALGLQKVGFNLLDGYFEMNGAYLSSEKLASPLYDFDFKIAHLSIQSAFESFNTVKKLAPFAEKMDGKFGAGFNISGSMNNDMSPVYEDMEGKGSISIANGSIKDVKLLKAVSKVSKLDASDGSLVLKDVNMQVEITEGRIYVQPFDVSLGGRKTTISGSAGVDGSLDYRMLTVVPSGQLGSAVNGALSSITGGKSLISPNIDLIMGVSGTYSDPEVKLISAKPSGSSQSTSTKALVKDKAQQKIEGAKEEAKKVITEKTEEVKDQAKEVIDEKKDEVKDKAKEELKNLFKKKK